MRIVKFALGRSLRVSSLTPHDFPIWQDQRSNRQKETSELSTSLNAFSDLEGCSLYELSSIQTYFKTQSILSQSWAIHESPRLTELFQESGIILSAE